jgi:toxin ParE1/3/4
VRFSYLREAEEELGEAFRYYLESSDADLAIDFLNEVERVAELLSRHRGFGASDDLGNRIFPLRRFPHSLVYRSIADGILILAVTHQMRSPKHWRNR